MKSVGIIGGGIFGVSCAEELGKRFEVTVFEKADAILRGASYGNQNRFHYGYHYPRSLLTGRECLDSLEDFRSSYGSALLSDFENYYCIANKLSKTTPEDYIAFCSELSLPYETSWPSTNYLDRGKISLSIRVPEPIFDVSLLRSCAIGRLDALDTVKLRLRTLVTDGRISPDGKKVLRFQENGEAPKEMEFDYIINCTYGNLNEICGLFGFEQRTFQYELVELPVILLPVGKRLGITVMDGPFCSILPFGKSDYTLLYHASKSVLDTRISRTCRFNDCFDSDWQGIIESSSRFMPILSKAGYLRSILVKRVVDPAAEKDDARRSEIIEHGSGCWSIFSGKIITAPSIAKRLAAQLEHVRG